MLMRWSSFEKKKKIIGDISKKNGSGIFSWWEVNIEKNSPGIRTWVISILCKLFFFSSGKSWKLRHWFSVDLSTVSNAKHFFSKTGCHTKIRSAGYPASWTPLGFDERSICVFLKAIMQKLTQQLKVRRWAWVIISAFLVDRRKTTHISLDYWWYFLLR